MREFVLLMALVGAMLIASPASAGNNNNSTVTNNSAENSSVVVEGDEDSKRRANTAPAPSLSVDCGSGFGAQGPAGGASAVKMDEVCQWQAQAALEFSQGNFEEAARSSARANKLLRWRTNPIRMFFQGIPLVGGYM